MPLGRITTAASSQPSRSRRSPRSAPSSPERLLCSAQCGNLGNPRWHGLCSRCLYFQTLLPVLAQDAASCKDVASPLLRAGEPGEDDLSVFDLDLCSDGTVGGLAGVGVGVDACERRSSPPKELSVLPSAVAGPARCSASFPLPHARDRRGCRAVVPMEESSGGAEFAAAAPAKRRMRTALGRSHTCCSRVATFTTGVTLLEIVLFAFEMLVSRDMPEKGSDLFFGPSWRALYKCGGLHLGEQQFWRLGTSMFLHAGMFHLLGNMVTQISVGRAVCVYTLSGLGGSLLSATLSSANQLTVGASGAIHGLLAAAAFGNDVVIVRQPMLIAAVPPGLRPLLGWQGVAFVLTISLLSGIPMASVDNWSHLGGALAGAAVAVVQAPRSSRRRRIVCRGVAAVAIVGYFSAGVYLVGCRDCFERPGQILEVFV